MSFEKISAILKFVTSKFKVVYLDFSRSEFVPYIRRKIGGVTRLDESTIYIHSKLSQREKELTLLHEVLSIYYYTSGILRHDEEVEEETKKIYERKGLHLLLQKYVR